MVSGRGKKDDDPILNVLYEAGTPMVAEGLEGLPTTLKDAKSLWMLEMGSRLRPSSVTPEST